MDIWAIHDLGKSGVRRVARQLVTSEFSVEVKPDRVLIADASRYRLSLSGVDAEGYSYHVDKLVHRGIERIIAEQAVASLVLQDYLQLNLAL